VRYALSFWPAWAAILMPGLLSVLTGCNGDPTGGWMIRPGPKGQIAVPEPINLLLPKEIRVHDFTTTQTFDKQGRKGIEVRMQALDAYGDSTKAFGDFRFELYQYRAQSLNPKGKLIATWPESVQDPRKNLIHWDDISRTYVFKLQWYDAIPTGKRFVLVAIFTSPFTERLFAERIFVAGQ